MNTKMSKVCEAATVKTKSLGNYQQTSKAHDIEHKRVTMIPSKEVVLVGQDHIVEITVKKSKGQKRTSPVASFSPGQKAEKKRSTTNVPPQNWGNVFRQQNLLHMTKEQSPKRSEDRSVVKKNINAEKQKNTVKHPIKSEEKHLKTPCCSSVLVQDYAVQCALYNAEIYNSNKLAEFNPVHMLSLLKQLQDLVNKKDKRTCEIFTEMEQILQKISNLETKEESNAVPLKESSKKMKAMSYEPFMLEREELRSDILKRDERLKEIDKKNSELASHAKMLTQKLDEATREKNDIMSVVADLRLQIDNNEKTITNLKTDLNKQIELAHKNYIDSKYLTMEKDKLSMLSSYKDTQIIDYRNTVKELQSQIAKQLKTINEICLNEGSTSPQTLIHTGLICSSYMLSPTSSSHDSNKSWHDLSDISSVDSVPEAHTLKTDAPVKDFELVSLLDGESSHTIMPDQNEVTNEKGLAMQGNENNTVLYQNVDTNDVTAKQSLHHSSKKGHNKENDIYKTRKFTRLKEKQNDNSKNLFLNASKALESITKSTVSDIKKQGDMQNRKPVNVPSPLRDCPHPDWSDSSLPSISTVSNLDMVSLNDLTVYK